MISSKSNETASPSMKIIESDTVKQLKTLVCLPFFTCVLIVLSILVILPFYLYRSFVTLLAKLQDPQITRVLTGLSASLLRDYGSHSTKPLSTIVVCLKCHGPLTVDQFREQFDSGIISRKCSKESGATEEALQFPELRQHYKVFMGYVFLRWDSNFNLDNHVKPYVPADGKPVTTSKRDLLEIREKLMVKPFQNEKSPWEVLFLDNIQDEENDDGDESAEKKAVIFIRIHHGIADGFSVQKMMCCLDPSFSFEDGNDAATDAAGVYGTFGFWYRNFLWNCHTALFGPYQMLNRMIRYKEPYHSLHLPAVEQSKEYFVAESPLLLVRNVKVIKKRVGVAFTTILLAVVCGGIRRFLTRNQIPFPALQCLGIPFTTGNEHTNKLENDFLIAPLNLPFHHVESMDRIMDIQRQLEKLRYSSVPKMLSLSINMLSCLPVNIMRSLARKSVFSTAYSTLPGPMKCIKVPGSQLDEVSFTYGTGAASLGLCFSSITYQGKFRMTIFVDKRLMQTATGEEWQKAQEMIDCLMEEYNELCEMIGILEE